MQIKKYLKNNAFASLLSGSVIAQALTLVSMPLITRLYGPTQFGLISIFINFITIPSALALFNFEGTLLVYKDLSTSKPIWLAFLYSMCIISILSLLAFVGLHHFKQFGIDKLPIWACIFVVLIIVTSGFSLIVKAILVREREYHTFSKIMVARNLLNALIRITGGFLGGGLLSLIMAEFVCLFAYARQLLKNRIKQYFYKLNEIKKTDLIAVLKQWKKFPLLEFPSQFVDQFCQVLPLLIIAQYLGATASGLYALSYRITFLPGSHLGSTMAEIFKGQFSHSYREGDYKNARSSLKKTLRNCVLLSIVFYLPIYFFLPGIIPFVFGNKWQGSGELIKTIVPWAATSFVVSTLSPIFSIMQIQHFKLIYDFSGLILFSSFIYFFHVKNLPQVSYIISASAVLANIIYFFLIVRSYNNIRECVEL